MKVLILAGGSGVRLWPLSTTAFPKQFISVTDHHSLLQQTVLRFLKVCAPREIFIISGENHLSLVKQQLSSIEPLLVDQVLLEPYSRNTFAAIFWSLYALKMQNELSENEPVLITPSDHYLPSPAPLLHSLNAHREIVSKGKLMLYGIVPTHPETGYGYIKPGEALGSSVYDVSSFIEKPSLAHAKQYIENGCLWNSGMFYLSLAFIEKQMRTINPQIWDKFQKKCLSFGDLPKQSFDYYLVEKANDVCVSPLETTWSDIGSWDGVYQILPKDQEQNVVSKKARAIDCKRCLLQSSHRKITALNLSDIMIIDSDEEILILPRGESQKVKEVASETSVSSRAKMRHSITFSPQEKRTLVEQSIWTIIIAVNASAIIDEQEVFGMQTYLLPPQKQALVENPHHQELELLQCSLDEVDSALSSFPHLIHSKKAPETALNPA